MSLKPKHLFNVFKLIEKSIVIKMLNRSLSTSKLNLSPDLHLLPISLIVSQGSDREISSWIGLPA